VARREAKYQRPKKLARTVGADAHNAGTDVRRLYAGLESRNRDNDVAQSGVSAGSYPRPGWHELRGVAGSLRMASVPEIQVHPSATTDRGRK
jgi:hypothetical protein